MRPELQSMTLVGTGTKEQVGTGLCEAGCSPRASAPGDESMAEIKHYRGGDVSTQQFDESVFGDSVRGRTLKQAVVMYEANLRSGTAKTKERGEVKGPNKKLWKQKHTGRARMGTPKSPLWRGGGRIFGPRPRDFSFHMSIKARRVALGGALLSKFQDGEVLLLDGLPTGTPSTKAAVGALHVAGITRDALVVTAGHDPVVHLSLRNVPAIAVSSQADLNAWEVLRWRHLVLTADALAALQARFAGCNASAGERN
jgi:large subunit ribosomal protein L4